VRAVDEPVFGGTHGHDSITAPGWQHPQRQHNHIVLAFFHTAVLVHHFDANDGVLPLVLGDLGDLGLDELDPHGLGVLIELLESLTEGANVHVVDGDIHERERTGQEHGLLDRIHAADARAVRNAEALVA
jgi:hypothetical protein